VVKERAEKRVQGIPFVLFDYSLSPSRYVSTGGEEEVVPLEEAVVLLQEAEEERAEADEQLDAVLTKLGFEGWRSGK
jgi:type I restriction enzyme M protein